MKTNNIFKSFLVCAVLLYAAGMQAQSRYFDERYIYTQAQVNPQLINPGAIGSAMKHQILLNYRNKWSGIDGAPRTVTLSYNGPVGNRLALGVNVLSDKFGELETTKGAVGLSYIIKSETNQVGFEYIDLFSTGLEQAVSAVQGLFETYRLQLHSWNNGYCGGKDSNFW